MLLTLLACDLSTAKGLGRPDDTAAPGGDPWACVETGRTPIDDPTVAAEGMAFAPADVAATFAGGFAGRFTFASTGEQFAGFGVNPEGAWELVSRQAEGDDLGEGAPIEACDPYYTLETEGILNDASGSFDERFTATLTAPSTDAVSLSASLPLDEVVGTTRPSWDPADWATNTLLIGGEGVPGTWTVSVAWSGASAADAPDADTGAVEVGGTSESVGMGTFTPAED